MTQHITFGLQAEQLVAKHLEQQGFKIVEQNYKKKYGEIDLIARKNNLLIFVEVKMRSNYYFDLAQVITLSKQKKIFNVASIYLAHYDDQDMDCRFDVALVQLRNNKPEITYLPNAFGEQ